MELNFGVLGTALLGLVLVVVLGLKTLTGFGARADGQPHEGAKRATAGEQPLSPRASLPQVTLVFGTQTGTAEKFAKTLKSQLESAYGSTTAFHVVDSEQYDFRRKLAKELLGGVFWWRRMGDGEPTDSAVDLHDHLVEEAEKADAADPPLKDVDLRCVWGWGTVSTSTFAPWERRLYQCMGEMGGRALLSLGVGDDDDDIDRDFDQWSDQVFRGARGCRDSGGWEDGGYDGGVGAGVRRTEVGGCAEEQGERARQRGAGRALHDPHMAPVDGGAGAARRGGATGAVCMSNWIFPSPRRRTRREITIGVFPENSPDVVRQAAALLGQAAGLLFHVCHAGGRGYRGGFG